MSEKLECKTYYLMYSGRKDMSKGYIDSEDVKNEIKVITEDEFNEKYYDKLDADNMYLHIYRNLTGRDEVSVEIVGRWEDITSDEELNDAKDMFAEAVAIAHNLGKFLLERGVHGQTKTNFENVNLWSELEEIINRATNSLHVELTGGQFTLELKYVQDVLIDITLRS